MTKEANLIGFIYKIILSDKYSLENFILERYQDNQFEFLFSDYKLTLNILDSSRSIAEIEMDAQERIRILEDFYSLMYGIDSIRFYFKGYIYDNSDQNHKHISCAVIAYSTVKAETSAHIVLKSFPLPIGNFKPNYEMSIVIKRYRDALVGKESILSFGFFYLSYLESYISKKEGLTNATRIRMRLDNLLNVDFDVFKEIGDLTSERGDLSIARKVKGNPLCNLTNAELNWLESKLEELIIRYCEFLADPNLPATLGRITK
jgi:hypothetical protein